MMISRELEVTLGLAVREAAQRRHEYLTLEHVLHALLNDTDVAEVIRQCGGDVEALQRDLGKFLDQRMDRLPENVEAEPQQTLDFAASCSAPRCTCSLPERTRSAAATSSWRSSASRTRTLRTCSKGRELPVWTWSAISRTAFRKSQWKSPPSASRRRTPRMGGRRGGWLAAAGILCGQLEPAGGGRRYRSADRARAGDRANHPRALPAAQEQPPVRRRRGRG